MVIVTPLFATLTWGLTSFNRYTLSDFICWGIPWTILYGMFWPYYTCGIIVLPFAYFHSLCYYLKLRMETLNNQIKSIKSVLTLSKALPKIITDYHSVLNIVDRSNTFWRNFTALIYFSYIPLNCFLLYQLIFANIDSIIMVMLFIVLLEESFLVLSFMVLSAAMVNAEAKKCFVQLNSLTKTETNLKNKLKVLYCLFL